MKKSKGSEAALELYDKKGSSLSSVMRRLRKNKVAMIGMYLFFFEIVIAIIAPLIMPYSYEKMDMTAILQSPSPAHWFGTDDLGRDILSRVLYGTRYSLSIGILGVVISTFVGIVIGAIAGYFGGWVDNILMRFLDIFQSIPGILLTIVISAVLGAGYAMTILALGISNIPQSARLLRASILEIRKMDYLEAADSINASKIRIIVKHILPNSFAPQIVLATMGVASTILAAASLSYIGLGVRPPLPEWGAMLAAGRTYIRDHAYLELFPGVCIMLTVLALNMFGDGLRDALDPKLKS